MLTTRWIAAALLAFQAMSRAEEWPMWRGPRGDGTSFETNVPVRWSGTENIAWKASVPGVGHSSPIVWGERVFVTTYVAEGDKRMLFCYDRRSGKKLWEHVVLQAPPEKKHGLNSYASSTPATDGQRVWVSFLEAPNVRLVCYDMNGRELWRRSPGTFNSRHGFCSSVLLHKNLVILNCDQDAQAYIVAYDKLTAKERWRIDRPNRTRSYCAPTIFQAAGKTQMVLSGSKCVTSYDPDTGRQHWIVDGPTEQFVASMVFTDNVFFMTGGFPELHLLGIAPEGTGNVTDSHVIWHHRNEASYVPSPIAAANHFFVVTDGGYAICLEAKTGNRMWREKLGRHHSASPVAAAGNLYFLDDDGGMFVIKASPRFELASRNLLGEDCRASPAISRGQMFLRSTTNLFCIGRQAR